jgi:ubiquinone/menaquinone biosynthesis C-methylase UbiE
MSWLLSKIYDPAMRRFEHSHLAAWRAAMLGDLTGRVLEIGAGTGANVPHYPREAEVVLAEPDPHMREKLRARAGRFEVSDAKAGALPFDDAGFDVVVSTLVLCSVRDLDRAVAEMGRVLRPGGKVIFIEHEAAARGSSTARWQRRLDPVWSRLTAGCHLTRDPEEALRRAGLEVAVFERHVEPSAALFPIVRGVATR